MTNLNSQQIAVLNAQNKQQAMLSNQAATNASAQFNAIQKNQFMSSLANTINQSNAQRDDAMSQFNTTEKRIALNG